MGLLQLFTRFTKPIHNLNNPFPQITRYVLKSPSRHSLHPNHHMGFVHSSSSSINHPKHQISTTNHEIHPFPQNPEMGSVKPHKDAILPNNPFCALHKFHNTNPFNSSKRSIHLENASLEKNQIAEDTDKLCKILSNHTGSLSNVELSLNRSKVTTVTSELAEEVLKKLSNAGALALSFFRWAEKKQGFTHTTEGYNALIEALGKIKQFNLIWNLVSEMKGRSLLTKETFALIMRRYARARKIKEAIGTFKKMESYGMNADQSDFSRLIDTLSKSRHVSEAQKLFDEMKNKRFSPDLRTYTILLEGWGGERNLLMVKEVFREMECEGFEPDTVTYGIYINAHCKSRKYDEALKIFREMEAKKCELSPHIFCTLINGLGSAQRLSEALEFFNRSKESGFAPEVPTYNALVGAYCWSSRFNDAFKVIEEMKRCGVGPNSRTYEIILHHLMKKGKRRDAYSIFEKMESEYGCEPSLNTYTMMVRMFCDEERVDMAIKVWNQMKSKGILPSMHMFSSLINGLSQENKLDDACKYFEEMIDVGLRPPGNVYGNLKQALLEAGRKDMAERLGNKLDRVRKTPLVV